MSFSAITNTKMGLLVKSAFDCKIVFYHADHALFPFFQTVRNLMNRVQMEPLTEVSSLFGFLGQVINIKSFLRRPVWLM